MLRKGFLSYVSFLSDVRWASQQKSANAEGVPPERTWDGVLWDSLGVRGDYRSKPGAARGGAGPGASRFTCLVPGKAAVLLGLDRAVFVGRSTACLAA